MNVQEMVKSIEQVINQVTSLPKAVVPMGLVVYVDMGQTDDVTLRHIYDNSVQEEAPGEEGTKVLKLHIQFTALQLTNKGIKFTWKPESTKEQA